MAIDRLEGRNGDIWKAYISGSTQEAIAEKHGITRERVSQILSQVRASIPEVDKEQLFQRELDFLDDLRQMMREQVSAPLPPAFNQRGMILTDEHGHVVRDESGRMAAVDRAIKLHERIAKMTGLEAPVKADLTVTEAAKEAAAKLAVEAAIRLREAGEAEES